MGLSPNRPYELSPQQLTKPVKPTAQYENTQILILFPTKIQELLEENIHPLYCYFPIGRWNDFPNNAIIHPILWHKHGRGRLQ